MAKRSTEEFRRIVNGELVVCPKATEVDLGRPDRFFAVRLEDPAISEDKTYKEIPKKWCVYRIDGKSVCWGDTQKSAVEFAKELLDLWGM